jgi:hypothetical protein
LSHRQLGDAGEAHIVGSVGWDRVEVDDFAVEGHYSGQGHDVGVMDPTEGVVRQKFLHQGERVHHQQSVFRPLRRHSQIQFRVCKKGDHELIRIVQNDLLSMVTSDIC